ncbi:hypothetical protein L1987_72696 [Smallanthus sonchifolius]|uniref:Uncharacterized protein n=1 Tax=Smallanthus sonchifolius TaxID=185202 RepID=A0ACB9AWM4_9ASTR|nr:hypothetical protein L1987_72696 [Smallanthus sonchifolius]
MGSEARMNFCGEEEFEDMLPKMAEKLGGEGLIKELCNGFDLLMDKDKGVITFESLKCSSSLLGLQDLRDDELMNMLKEGDHDGDGALNQMEFCVLMFRLSPELMMESEALLDHALQQEFDFERCFKSSVWDSQYFSSQELDKSHESLFRYKNAGNLDNQCVDNRADLEYTCQTQNLAKRIKNELLGFDSVSNASGDAHNNAELVSFSFKSVLAATGSFSVKNKLGEGGFGSVYKIVTGKRNSGSDCTEDAVTVSEWAWENWMEGRGVELIDPSMRDTCNPLLAVKCINVGLLCVQEIMEERPTMSEVVVMLSNETATIPLPNKPAFTIHRRSQMSINYTNNEVTMTNVHPR